MKKLSSRPEQLKSISEGDIVVRIVKDEREPFGSIKFTCNEAGLDHFHVLINEYNCNGIELLYHGIANKKIVKFFDPDLDKIERPELILDLQLAEAGAFHPDFDFQTLELFKNVKSFTIWDISMDGHLFDLFPNLEVLRILNWNKNRIEYREGLWPKLRCLHIAGFKGDLSIFSGWDIRSLFLDSANVTPFASIGVFKNLETLRADYFGSDIDLSGLSGLGRLKHLRMQKPRRSPKTVGFNSESIEMMVLDKIDRLDLERDFPNLKIYGIDLSGAGRLDEWDGFEDYGDPFAAVHFRRYPFAEI